MSDICSKHGPYSVLCKMCDFEAPTPPQGDARVTVPRVPTERMINEATLECSRDHAQDPSQECCIRRMWERMLSAAPQTRSTDDEARRLLERANWLYAYACTLERPQPDIISCVECMRSAAALLSRIPSEEATEEDAFKTCDAIEAVMSKWQSVPSNGGYVVSQFSQAGLRITRTPGGQT